MGYNQAQILLQTPKLMTFEDSQGRLQTIRYSAQSQCINNK